MHSTITPQNGFLFGVERFYRDVQSREKTYPDEIKPKKQKNSFADSLEFEELNIMVASIRKPQIKLNNKSEHCDKLIWGKEQIFKKFNQMQNYFKVDFYSPVKAGDVAPLRATAHMISYINRDVINLEGVYAWLVDMNKKRCEKPFTDIELYTIAKEAYANKEVEPKAKCKYKYLFKKGLKLTHAEIMGIINTDTLETNVRNFHELLDNWTLGEKYTAAKAAKMIGIKPNTIYSWISRFPELYADAGEKIKNIKKHYMEKKNGNTTFVEEYFEDMINDPDVEFQTEANWDNTESTDYKMLETSNWFTRTYLEDLKNNKLSKDLFISKPKGIYEKEMDEIEKDYPECEVMVYINENSGERFIRISDETFWFEDGLVRGIYNLDETFLPHTVVLKEYADD